MASNRKRRHVARRKGSPMSDKLIRNLNELSDSIQENSARVECLLSSGGSRPDPAVVLSAAKYHKALELLADE